MNKDERNLEQKIKDHFDVAMEQSKEHFGLLSDQIKGVSDKVEILQKDMKVVKSDVIDLKGDVRILKEDMKEVKSELKIKADKETVENHENRIIKLENASLVK